MRTYTLITIILIFVSLVSCGPNNSPKEPQAMAYGNPAAEGFNKEASDAKAIEIADQVMDAMGGREAWDKTKLLAWNFFGARKLLWDKETGWVRIENQNDDLKIIVNINTNEGRVYKNGQEFQNQDSLDFYLDRGKRIWINDSYWLAMPFKLKDSGVTLKYLEVDTTQTGETADVLHLSFENVGVTPQNNYKVWVDQEAKLVTQWAYFKESGLAEPNFITPWGDYAQYGNLILSSDRGERDVTDIAVLDAVPEGAFSDFSSFSL